VDLCCASGAMELQTVLGCCMGEDGEGQGFPPKSFICLPSCGTASMTSSPPCLPAVVPGGALCRGGSRASTPCPGAVRHAGLWMEDAPDASEPEEVKNSWRLKPKLDNLATVPGNAYLEPGLCAGGHGFSPHLHFLPLAMQTHTQ